MERTLIIFARLPRVGTVKSRLAKDIGAVNAWRLYRSWVGGLIRELTQDERWTTRIAVTPDMNGRLNLSQNGYPKNLNSVNQGGGDLGDRMRRQFRRAAPNPTVIIGTDLPEISREQVWQAFRSLRKSAAVLGPSVDGGYWLIGLNGRMRYDGLFDGVRWSSQHTLSDTVETLKGAKVTLLEQQRDIDTLDDLKTRMRWSQ